MTSEKEETKEITDEEFDRMFPDFDDVVEAVANAKQLMDSGKTIKEAVDIVYKGGNIEDPEALGWGHFGGEYFEIQALDVSSRFKSPNRDEEAVLAHREECGCSWPEIDYQQSFMRWLEDAKMFPGKWEKKICVLEELASDREKWPENLPRITSLTVELLAVSSIKNVDEPGGNGLLHAAMQGAMKLLTRLSEDTEAGRAKLNLVFTDGYEWKECPKCGRGFYPPVEADKHGENCSFTKVQRKD